jgi:glycosyltransferase involved in cell wall biosynthesis
VPFDELGDYIRRADVCLGVFGEGRRAVEELTNKVVEQLACGKPLITAQSAPLEELVCNAESALLIPPGNPIQIAGAILRLRENIALRQSIATNGRRVYAQQSSLNVFSRHLRGIVADMAGSRRRCH